MCFGVGGVVIENTAQWLLSIRVGDEYCLFDGIDLGGRYRRVQRTTGRLLFRRFDDDINHVAGQVVHVEWRE